MLHTVRLPTASALTNRQDPNMKTFARVAVLSFGLVVGLDRAKAACVDCQPQLITGNVAAGDGSQNGCIPGTAMIWAVEVGSGIYWPGFELGTVPFPGTGAVQIFASTGFGATCGPGPGSVNHYFKPPGSAGATCQIDGAGCPVCQGTFNISLYAHWGGFEGQVRLMPAATPAPAGVTVSAGPSPIGFTHTTTTDSTGKYKFNRAVECSLCGYNVALFDTNNWGVEVLGPGTTHGTWMYRLSAARPGFVPKVVDMETRSSFPQIVDLDLHAENMEEPDMRSCPAVGEPVSVATGNVFFDQTDATVPGVAAHGLQFVRSYNSANSAPGRFGVFGPGWWHNYERRLAAAEGTVLLVRDPNGVPAYFEDNDADNVYKASVPFTSESSITKQADQSFVRTFRRGGSERYQSLAAGGRLTAIVDPSGNTTTLGYDPASGQLLTITDPGSRQLTLAYPSSTEITLSGPAGPIATYTIGANGLSEIQYADGDGDALPDGGFTFEYQGTGGRLSKVTDFSGRVVETHEYDSQGRALTSEKSGGVEKFTLQYEPLKTTVTDALGNVTVYEYTNVWGQRRVTKMVGPCPSCGSGADTQEWTYDAKAREKTHRDGEGNVTTYAYNEATGDLLSEARTSAPGVSHVTGYTYHPDGRIATRTDPNGRITEFTYGAAGPTLIREQITASTWRETDIEYTAQGKRWKLRNALDHQWEFFHNTLGDLEWVRDPTPQHNETRFTYDSVGRLRQVTRPAVSPPIVEPITTYDTLGRTHRITNPDQTYTEFKYDGGGRRTSVRDASGWLTEYTYDTFGRLWKVKDPELGETVHGYDLASNLVSLTDARGKTTTFAYELHNRVRKTCYPSDPGEPDCHRYEEFTYDGNGRVKTRKDRRPVVTTYAYDGLGRLTGRTYNDGTKAVTFTYDENGLDQRGRLTRALVANETLLNWAYDLAGQPTTAVSNPSPFSGVTARTITYTYDEAGNRLTVGLNGQQILAYDWEERGLLENLQRMPNRTYVFGYDAAARRTTLTYPNGVVTTYGYDNRSRLASISAAGQATITSFTYPTHDAVGNRASRGGATAPAESYGYDKLYRLLSVTRGAPPPSESYTYDPAGNRMTAVGVPSWTYNNRNELVAYTAATLAYDLNGNLTQKVEGGLTWTYEWDGENRLKKVRKNGTEVASYRYDALGRRALRTVKTGPGPSQKENHFYTYDGEDILQESFVLMLHGGEEDVDHHVYTHGPGIDEPLEVQHGTGNVWYYHPDGLGSIVRVTDHQQTIVTGMSRQYDAFGTAQIGSAEEGYAYTGREWDPETALYYYRARYYDPRVGRFLSEDPIGFSAGPNLYLYTRNNPVTFSDPSGLLRCPRGSDWTWGSVYSAAFRAERRQFPHNEYPHLGGYRHCVAVCLLKRHSACGLSPAAEFHVWLWDLLFEDPTDPITGEDSRLDIEAEQEGLKCAAGDDTCENECLKKYPHLPPDPKRPPRRGPR